MSTKTFKSASSGRVLEVERGAATVDLFIGKAGSFKCFEVNLADAPTLALAILEAAGVRPGKWGGFTHGTPQHLQSIAADLKSYIRHRDEAAERAAREAERLAAEAADREVLERRRDEVAKELGGDTISYKMCNRAFQNAIDRIVELEAKP